MNAAVILTTLILSCPPFDCFPFEFPPFRRPPQESPPNVSPRKPGPEVLPPSKPEVAPPKASAAQAAATVRISTGFIGGTATVINAKELEGKTVVLTAAHCVKGLGSESTIRTKKGDKFTAKVIGRWREPDIAVLLVEGNPLLESVNVASSNPTGGIAAWHVGYGINKPTNLEAGIVRREGRAGETLWLSLYVSSGDSGSGIFNTETGELIGVVSGYSGRETYAGSAVAVNKLIKAIKEAGY